MTSRPFTLLVNPRAGAGRVAELVPRLEQAFRARASSTGGAAFELVETRGPGDATRCVREALERGSAGVAVVGGDGTLSEATNGFFEGTRAVRPDAWLAPLSCGTGGDFRKTIGSVNVPRSGEGIEALVAQVLAATPRPIDVGHLRYVDRRGDERERVFLNITSFGIGGLVDELVNDGPKWLGGGPAFLLGTVRALVAYRPAAVRVRVDEGEPREVVITNLAVANGRYFGGGMFVAPKAELDDGRFDVVTMPAIAPHRALRLLPRLYRGTHLDSPHVHFERGRVVVAESVDPSVHVLLDVDGEAPGRLPARFEVLPGALLLRA